MSDIIAMHRADLVEAVQEAVKPLKATIAALEAKCRAVEIDRDSWRRLAERYETNCTGRHGSQMSCGNVPTALETAGKS